jgi:cell wall-associated NlpC family hydrolase
MEQQWAMAKPWGIILCDGVVTRDPFWFGDEVPMPPLEGRSFRHGVTDCFSLVRDYYRSERGILLPYSPRDNAWWQDHRDPVSREVVFKAQNLYEDALAQLPFRKLRDSEPLEPGDGMLFAIRSATGANHGAVYVGDGMMLHHPAPLSPRDGNSLSRKELVARYHNFRTGYYRWEG